MRPSTIFSITAGGLPDACACSEKMARSRSTAAGSISSTDSDRGEVAAMCMPIFRPISVSLALSDTADCSATSTPIRPRSGATALWT